MTIYVSFRDVVNLVRQLPQDAPIVAGQKHRGTAAARPADHALHHLNTITVKRVGRLIEQEQIGRLHDRSGNAQTLLHAEREALELPPILSIQANGMQHLRDGGLPHLALNGGKQLEVSRGRPVGEE